MIRELTDWETGRAVYVDIDFIKVVRRLPASVSESGLEILELGGRTRIDIGSDMLLVRETPEEIMKPQVDSPERIG